MKANDKQHGGTHYQGKHTQPWDFIAEHEETLGFFLGNVVKYLCRWKRKGGIQDLEKAAHYIQKKIEVERSNVRKVTK